jgi:transposase
MPRYKQMPLEPSQLMLYGQSVEDAVPRSCDVRAYRDVTECLDYSCLEARCCERGCPPYPPEVMLRVLGYAYSKGIRSSRKIEQHLNYDVRFIWLAGGLKPDHNTIARFRKENWEEFKGLFAQSARLCCEFGLVSLNVVSTDGSKIRAAASKKQMYNQGRLEREMAAVEKILQEAEQTDRAEDEQDGGNTDDKLPEHLRDANERKARLQQIAKQLGASDSKCVVVSEPESRAMETGDGIRPAYNLQACVDAESQVIVAMDLTQAINDVGQLPSMSSEVERVTGMSADAMLADGGYVDEATLIWTDQCNSDVLMPVSRHWRESRRDANDLFANRCFLLDEDRDVLICPAGRQLTFRGQYRTKAGGYRRYQARDCRSCSFYELCVADSLKGKRISVSVVEPQRVKLRDKLVSAEGKRLYALRKQTVEPVFGRIKSNLEMSRFLLCGLKGATAEAALICMVHNVLKCMTSAAATTYESATNARAFVADIACSIQLAFAATAIRIFAARRSYAKAQAAF